MSYINSHWGFCFRYHKHARTHPRPHIQTTACLVFGCGWRIQSTRQKLQYMTVGGSYSLWRLWTNFLPWTVIQIKHPCTPHTAQGVRVLPAWAHIWHFPLHSTLTVCLSVCVCVRMCARVCECESDTLTVREIPTVFSFNMTPKTQHHIKALRCSGERPVWVPGRKLSSVTVFLGSYWAKIRDIDTDTIKDTKHSECHNSGPKLKGTLVKEARQQQNIF